ncbi:hypothetical protein QE152_g38899 [Popillia japonica]|uniref:Uncharacterized protein n=1 Tax=Popillia japonica TaxID=7064 RepID=A0AAW1HV60_POPJA
MKEHNLNERIKVKLTPLGVDIYYHSFDRVRNAVPSINGMPKIDEDGFTEFSMWDFIHLYGEHIGIGKKEVLKDCCIYLEDKRADVINFKFEADDITPETLKELREKQPWTISPNCRCAFEPIYYPNGGTLTASRVSGEIKADKPSGKVYIAALTTKVNGNSETTNGGVFTTKEKAVECIKGRGFTLLSPYGSYHNPVKMTISIKNLNWGQSFEILERHSLNDPKSEEYKKLWDEAVWGQGSAWYRIEEHYVDLEE